MAVCEAKKVILVSVMNGIPSSFPKDFDIGYDLYICYSRFERLMPERQASGSANHTLTVCVPFQRIEIQRRRKKKKVWRKLHLVLYSEPYAFEMVVQLSLEHN